jgi:uracil-DNA glycosylase
LGVDRQTLEELVAMGKFLGSLDEVGVAKSAPGKRAARSRAAMAPVKADAHRGAVVAEPLHDTDAPEPRAAVEDTRDRAVVEASLKAIREDLGDCKRCGLCTGRTNIVFGQGNAVADLMFVGEGPGADEDAQGLAFVGRAGQLLTDMIEKGMRMKRADVFIANVVKCRPPGNRTPEPDEILKCQPFLEAQIRAIQPKVIVALGATAARFMTRTADPISRLRSKFATWDGIPVMPTFHPAYLLRNPVAKKDVWADLKLVMEKLGRRPE